MATMNDSPLRTAADDLLELVRKKGKIEISQAIKDLRLPPHSVQALVDFLVEEKILGIEYKFTTPYIYLNDDSKRPGAAPKDPDHLLNKEEFYRKARERGASEQQTDGLWQRYLQEHKGEIHDEFMRKAMEKGATLQAAERLWGKYLRYL